MYLRRWCQQASPWAIGSQGTFSPIINIIVSIYVILNNSYKNTWDGRYHQFFIKRLRRKKKLQMQKKILAEANSYRATDLVSKKGHQRSQAEPQEKRHVRYRKRVEKECKQTCTQGESILFCCMSNRQNHVYLTNKQKKLFNYWNQLLDLCQVCQLK